MHKLRIILAIPLAFVAALVAVEFPPLGLLALTVPVAVFAWLVRSMRQAPAPLREPLFPPADPGEVVDAIFDDDAPVAAADDALATAARSWPAGVSSAPMPGRM
jgi:hypothetical protein